MLTGKSLSLCIRDVLEGIVEEHEIHKIITSTKCPDLVSFEKILDQYSSIYWSIAPERGKSIALRLWNENKIEQPRLLLKDTWYNRDILTNIWEEI